MRRILFVAAILSGMTTTAHAQTKISARLSCEKPSVNEAAGDGQQAVMFTRANCNWSPSYVIEGSRARHTADAGIGDISGSTARVHGFSTDVMDNGDSVIVRYEGTSQMKKDRTGVDRGTWRFVRGTGKFKGITGKGTFKGAEAADGTGFVDVTGYYSLAKTKRK